SAPIPPTLSFRFGYIVSRRTFVAKPLFFALCARNGPEASSTMSHHDYLTRRWFFKECAVGLGTIALHTLLHDGAVATPDGNAPAAAADPMAPRRPHFPARATNVIFLFMAGGPSHLELFDHKPTLARYDGRLPPPELLEGYR